MASCCRFQIAGRFGLWPLVGCPNRRRCIPPGLVVPVSMICLAKVSRSTMAAHSRAAQPVDDQQHRAVATMRNVGADPVPAQGVSDGMAATDT
jgi:hypothetical protein